MSVRLKSNLLTISAEIRPLVDDACADSAQAMAEDARGRVPVDSGRLRDSIRAEKTGELEHRTAAGDNKAFYARFVEFGTRNAGARPYMIPAFEAEKAVTEARVANALRRAG